MTVLQVLPALQSGGVERGTLEVAAALVHNGHRSLVVSGGGRLVSDLIAAGSAHITWPIGRKSLLTLRYVRRLRQLLLKERIDILHARSRLPAWIAWLAWRGMDPAARPRFVTTVHGLYSVNAYSAIMVKGEQVITVSDYAREYVRRHFPAAAATHITSIHRGVDSKVYSQDFSPGQAWLTEWQRQYPALADRFLITLPGRVGRRKGVYDFIKIIAVLRERGLAVHGLIVGEIPRQKRELAEDLQAAMATAGVADAITCTGYREDVREIMSISGAVLSLSLKPEAFGRTVNEALSLGVPVAGYVHGGVGEQLERHFPAGVIPPGDTTAMAECLATWYATLPSLQGVRPYELKQMLDKTLDLYQSLVS